MNIDRRRFLSLLALGAPAAVVAEKLGLLSRLKTYFFAPRGGWSQWDKLPLRPEHFTLSMTQSAALQLEKVRALLPTLYEIDNVTFEVLRDNRSIGVSSREIRVALIPGMFPHEIRFQRSC